MEIPSTVIILAAAAYLPPIFFAGSLAYAKRYRREPLGALVKAFLWGATFAAAIALFFNTWIQGAFVRPTLRDEALVSVAVAVLVAPVVEEAAKPFILYRGSVRRNCDEIMDGLIYGAVAGLGFAATENLLYEAAALFRDGRDGFLLTAVARTFSATLLHAVTGATVGYGIAHHLNTRKNFLIVIPFYMLAVIIHSGYNAALSFGAGYTFLPLIVVIVFGFLYVRKRIRELSLVAPSTQWLVLPGEEPAAREPPTAWRRVPGEEGEAWAPQRDPARRGRPPEDDWRR